MRTEEIISRLEGVTGEGPWKARCPAHEDHNPSLSISRKTDGTLLHCHAGCDVNSVTSAIGLSPKDLFNSDPLPVGRSPRIVATYPYHNEQGTLCHEAVRMDPKDFRQRRPDGQGGWIWNMKGEAYFPYRLPKILGASADAAVWIVEGEKDVESLVGIGLVATCNIGGAGKWRPEFAKYFAGRDVTVIPDNDVPGRKHAESVAKSLTPVARSVRVLHLGGLPAGGDVSDWLARPGNTPSELQSLASRCPEWTPAELQDEEPPDPKRFTLTGIPLGKFLRTPLKRNPLVWTTDGRTIIESQQNCICGGGMKGMKTSIGGNDLGFSLATGTPFLGEFPTKKCRVAFLTAESGKVTIQDHLRRISEARRIEIPEDFDNMVIEDQLPRVSQPGHMEELERFCRAGGFEVVILDPLYWALSGEATDRGASNVFTMGAQLQKLGHAIPGGTTCVLIHHFGKAAARNGVNTGEPPTLEDLAMAGVGEWCRQWILLGRRTAYDGESGTHHLWMNVGGSAGHSSLWGLDIREGRQNDIGGRRWAVTVRTSADVLDEKESAKEDEQATRREAAVDRHRETVLAFIQKKVAVTKRDMREVRGVRKSTAEDIFEDLLASGELMETTVKRGNGRSYTAFKLAPGPSGSDWVPDPLTDTVGPAPLGEDPVCVRVPVRGAL